MIPALGGLTAHERYFFDVNGYVVRHDVLPLDVVRALNSAIDVHWPTEPGESLMSQRFHGFLGWPSSAREPFLSLLDHPAAVGICADLLGDEFRLDHCYGIHMRPGTSGLTMHGGGAPHDPSQYYRHLEGRMYNGLIGVAWGLTDHRPGSGGFCCIPGSHHASEELPEDVAVYSACHEWIREVPLPPGSMLVFSEALTHGTLPWHGPGVRRALFYKYAPAFIAWSPAPPWDAEAFGTIDDNRLPVEVLRSLGQRHRDLLRPPSVPYRRSIVESGG